MSDHNDGTGRADGPSSEIPATHGDIATAVQVILDRLASLERRIDPPAGPVIPGRPPFRQKGRAVSAAEYEARTGIPRVAAAVALHLLQFSQEQIAHRVGVNRRTLQIGPEFEPYRSAIVAVRLGSGIARQGGGDE